MESDDHFCPLCLSPIKHEADFVFKGRNFYRCHECHLLSVCPDALPDALTEKNRYLNHQNTIENTGYTQFLQQVVDPIIDFIPKGAKGLDYGCGPAPVLVDLLKKEGYECAYYDPFFYPELPQQKYQFITATECFEHFHKPLEEIEKILDLLVEKGILALMTETWSEIESLNNWHYIRDITHVSIFNIKTIEWMTSKFDLEIIYTNGKNVFLFRKKKRSR